VSSIRVRSYTAQKYEPPTPVYVLDVSSKDFLILLHSDAKRGTGSAGKTVMSYPHLPRFVAGLESALEMLRDGCFAPAGDNSLRLTEKGESAVCKTEDLYAGASLGFAPIVIPPREDGAAEGIGEAGIRIFINSWDFYSDASVEDFAAFVAFYVRFDLFATSRSAIILAAQAAAAQGAMFNGGASVTPPPRRKNP
jgi:hypothetical protein